MEPYRGATALAKDLGMRWPQNVLRHSFISYRLAQVKNVQQVALEAGNSPAIIFKHCCELTTEEQVKSGCFLILWRARSRQKNSSRFSQPHYWHLPSSAANQASTCGIIRSQYAQLCCPGTSS